MKGLICVRLRTAGLLIGWIGLVFSLLSVIVFVLCFNRLDELAKLISDRTEDSEANVQRVRHTLCFICSLYLGINMINLITSMLLIIAITRERHVLLVPWLFNSGVWLCFNFIYFIYFAIISVPPGQSVAAPLLGAAISLGIQLSIWGIIYALYRKFQDEREQHLLSKAVDSKMLVKYSAKSDDKTANKN